MVKYINIILILILFSFHKKNDWGDNWNTIQKFPEKWTKVERDSLGYLIYDPCNGITPQIIVNNDSSITFKWPLEDDAKHFLQKFEKKNTNYFIIKSYLTTNNERDGIVSEQCSIEIKVVSQKQKLVLWKWYYNSKDKSYRKDTIKWVMTPRKYENKFRKINNHSESSWKIMPEKEFLPIEFN